MDLQGDVGAAPRSRDGAVVITPSFESVWPDVERRLRALLFRRGVDNASVDDIVQEVALRALANQVTYASAKDLLRWAGPVACNLHVDLVRHRARVLDDVDTDRAGPDDVYGEVADRMELHRAFRGIAALRPADREAIIDAVAEEPVVPRTRKEAVRLAVRRHRARSRLILAMEKLAGTVLGVRWLTRGRRAAALAAFAPVAMLPVVGTWRAPAHGPETTLRPAVVAPAARSTSTARVRQQRANAPMLRPASTEIRRTVAASPEDDDTRRSAHHQEVGVQTPTGSNAHAGGDDRRPDDKTVCLTLPVLDVICY
jgi:DNA-directed RNA polymerase specialized sigma24 family protein